jgi:hypothetical protein
MDGAGAKADKKVGGGAFSGIAADSVSGCGSS